MKARHRYKISQIGSTSAKHGLCEVCGKSVNDIYYQSEEREYQTNKWTQYGCNNLFGHKDCLLSIQN